MSHSGVIVNRNANKDIPDAYVEKALAANPTAWGAAMVVDETVQVNSGGEMDLELFKQSIEVFKDTAITFYFCNSPSAINMEDVSPFTLLEDGDKNPVLVAFVDGSFPGYAKSGSAHPDLYFFVQEYLQLKINDLAELCDGDLDKVMAQLEKPQYKKDFLAQSQGGTITFVCATGKSLTYHQGKGDAEYPWGWVSQNYGYGLAEQKEDTKEKKRSIFPNRSTVREPAAAVAVKGVTDTPPATAGAAVILKNSDTPAIPSGYKTRKEKPPGHLSRQDRKKWYQMRIGYAPKGWEGSCEITVLIDSGNNTVKVSDLRKLGLEQLVLKQLPNPPNANQKDTQPEHVKSEATLPAATPAVSSEILPIMSPGTREYINKLRTSNESKKIIDENGEKLKDPREIVKIEEKHASFPAQLGAKSMDELLPMSYSMMFDISRNKPDGAANFIFSLRNMVYAQRETIRDLKEKLSKHLSPEEVHTVAKEELKPEVKKPRASIFPRRAAG